jgi:hypothetical protein
MPERTTRSTVTFAAPFKLEELDEVQPAGTYDIDTIEQAFEGNERTVYVRVETLLYIRSAGTTRTVTVDPNGLDDALERDSK